MTLRCHGPHDGQPVLQAGAEPGKARSAIILVHGRGDSARRVLGKPPITLAHTEEAIRVIRALVAGETIAYEGTDLHFPWTAGWTLPVWVAGSGPMALAMTGRRVSASRRPPRRMPGHANKGATARAGSRHSCRTTWSTS